MPGARTWTPSSPKASSGSESAEAQLKLVMITSSSSQTTNFAWSGGALTCVITTPSCDAAAASSRASRFFKGQTPSCTADARLRPPLRQRLQEGQLLDGPCYRADDHPTKRGAAGVADVADAGIMILADQYGCLRGS